MLQNLKIKPEYDGFLYLMESIRNPPTLESHHHVELELNLVIKGHISYVMGGRRFAFGPQTLLWLFPSQEHQLVDRSPDAQNYVAVFKPALIARSCRGTLYAGLKGEDPPDDGIQHTILAPAAFELIRKTMDGLMAGALDSSVLNREAGFGVTSAFQYDHSDPDGLNAGLHHLLLLCWRSRQSGVAGQTAVVLHPIVHKALQLLSGGGEELTLGQLARRCGASQPHLSRLFAKQLGTPITDYRNSVRLGRFIDQISQPPHKTITEAAFAAGFGSYAQFHRVFTRTYGRAPRDSLRAATSSQLAKA